MIVGVRGETVRNNIIEDNDCFCIVQSLSFGLDCLNEIVPRDGDPSASRNITKDNQFIENGAVGFPPLGLSGRDIIYLQSEDEFLFSGLICFENNVTQDGEPASFLLPTSNWDSVVDARVPSNEMIVFTLKSSMLHLT